MGCGSSTPHGGQQQQRFATKGGDQRSRQVVNCQSSSAPSSGASPAPTNSAADRAKLYAKAEVEFTLLTPSDGQAPSARKMHTAVAVQDHSLVVFGGVSRKEAHDNTEDLEASMNLAKVSINHRAFRVSVKPPKVANWHAMPTNGDAPSPRATHRAVNIGGSMYVFGAHTKKCSDVFVYNLAFQQWRRLTTTGNRPRPTSGCSLCKATQALAVFGGETDYGISNDLYVLDIDTCTWVNVPPRGPLVERCENIHEIRKKLLPRRDHSALVVGDRMLVFGGFSVDSDALDFVEFNARSQEWSTVTHSGEVPRNRGAHCATMYGSYMIVFGGQRHGRFLNDLHVFDTSTGVWSAVSLLATPESFIPSPRAFAASSHIGDTWYIHGGGDDGHIFSDFFKVNIRTIARCADPTLPLEGEAEPIVPSEAWKQMVRRMAAAM